ncbi:importin subunit alpha-2 [Olea europaea subsp. europaea]|uniref:Importin subunit alpha-2 n=1 Tax=Olea europaea subsp. europaea TaxID=158383 RepID=A0A8S0UAD8_OLEEU|nr:importin subunit alpha-2 [Olea europaea subsp. europaea]
MIETNIIGPLVHLLQNTEFEIKKEVASAISNATSGGTHEQIKYLLSQQCVKLLCDLLVCPDPRFVTVCLEGLESILKFREAKNLGWSGDINLYAQMIDDAEEEERLTSEEGCRLPTREILEFFGVKLNAEKGDQLGGRL